MALEHKILIANDGDLHNRIAAAFAGEQMAENPNAPADDPLSWAIQRKWKFASQPGWEDPYHSAVVTDINRPGMKGNVISDAMILAAVQAVLIDEAGSS